MGIFDFGEPNSEYQRVGDWFEQRSQFRAAALQALRKREGLPQPVDPQGTPLETRFDDQGHAHYSDASGKKVDRVLFEGTGRKGKPGGFAIGKRKGLSREEADLDWNRPAESFQILETAEDGRKLSEELKDLNRDSDVFAISQNVSHGDVGEQAPGLVLDGLKDEEVDARLQEYIQRGS